MLIPASPGLGNTKCFIGFSANNADMCIPFHLAFQIPSASKDVYKYSFFPQTIRDWNDLPGSLISSSELSDDSVSKFTSLVRARD